MPVWFRLVFNLKSLFSFLVVVFALSQTACIESNEPMYLPADPVLLSVMTEKGKTNIQVEIAKTSQEKAKGLMFRAKLPQNQGMLFTFEEPDLLAFWMKNTPQPLDIIYIAPDGKLVSVQKGEPLSTDPIPSGGPAQFVLEMARGEATRIGLKPGNLFSHPVIESSSK